MNSEWTRKLKKEIKHQANLIGFDLFGVTSADAPENLNIYSQWLEAGHHAEMHYLATERARERRADPRNILPECKSILALGSRYPKTPEKWNDLAQPNNSHNSERSPIGRISSYALGDDYHDVLEARLKELVTFIENRIGYSVPNRCYTDTGPILEREIAQRAGLGWIGKNSCLINPDHGSYLFLSEILLGLELEPDETFPYDRCGTCTRCIDACPTSAILANRTIDSRKCISYLTIENKGEIPKEVRHQIGDWIFGCDICQMVCPWNQKINQRGIDTAFQARPGYSELNLLQETKLDQTSFNIKFRGSPIKRAKRRGYLRNVVVALAHYPTQEVISSLEKALFEEPETLVRAHAAWSLAQISHSRVKDILSAAANTEQDDSVLKAINQALQEIND